MMETVCIAEWQSKEGRYSGGGSGHNVVNLCIHIVACYGQD